MNLLLTCSFRRHRQHPRASASSTARRGSPSPAVGRGDVLDDLAGSPQIVEACPGMGQPYRVVVDLLLQRTAASGGAGYLPVPRGPLQ